MSRLSAVVFLGPSLPLAEARKLLPRAEFRGPARQGDVLKAIRLQPRAIALIDGVFESQPSVWHQELRIALAEGVQLFGASSMGALRAAELAPFGMVGIGAVFDAYTEGRLVDDADVALLHADAEHDYRPLSIPLVNVIAMADAALRSEVLSKREARQLIDAARALHYHHRHWTTVLESLRWSPEAKSRFNTFRREHPRDVKADDARTCLAAVREWLKAAPAPVLPSESEPSVWARRAWLSEQGQPPSDDGQDGLRTLLIAEWCRSLGLAPDPDRVAHYERRSAKLHLDGGLRRRFAEALALEELVLRQPGLLSARAPSLDEGRWVDAIRFKRR